MIKFKLHTVQLFVQLFVQYFVVGFLIGIFVLLLSLLFGNGQSSTMVQMILEKL